jgi:hypothetical protein
MSETLNDQAMFEAIYAKSAIYNITRPSRTKALTTLKAIVVDERGRIPTINRVHDIFGTLFQSDFRERIGVIAARLPVTELMPVTINPQFVMAGQLYVLFDVVQNLLQMKVKDFLEIAHTKHDPQEPIVLVKTIQGYISADGHHRLRALQLRGNKRVTAYTLPEDHRLNKEIVRLFRQYGYTNNLKRTA